MPSKRWIAWGLALLLASSAGCSDADESQQPLTPGPSTPTGPRCSDGEIQGDEQCDGQPHCEAATCRWNASWQCSSSAPYACHSGIVNPETEVMALTDAELTAFCEWTQEVLRPRLAAGVPCPGGSITFTPLDCQQDPESFMQRGTVAGCHASVGVLEECVAATEADPCRVIFEGSVACGVQACDYAEPGAVCNVAAECESEHCCPQGSSSDKVCSATDCQPAATFDTCTTDAFCAPGSCIDGRCLVEKLAPGKACDSDEWCTSGSCKGGLCKGFGGDLTRCEQDWQCEVDRVCCSGWCEDKGKGCLGGVGDECGFFSGTVCIDECVGEHFCSKPCAADVDCGRNPWGFPNHCAENWAHELVCFSGCETSDDCLNVGGDFYCIDVVTVAPGTPSGKVCSGGPSIPDDGVVLGH